MKIYAISDIHVNFSVNNRWLNNLSYTDYKQDILILAGDVAHIVPLFEQTLKRLKKRFLEIIFIPGNHDLWVNNHRGVNSIEKLKLIQAIADDCGIWVEPFHTSSLAIIPLFGWFDYSFGQPSKAAVAAWADFAACKWPRPYDENSITHYFLSLNEPFLDVKDDKKDIISFSHFLPRIDLMPGYIPHKYRNLYPMLGTTYLEKQIRELHPIIHVYGHSHVNNCVRKGGILYINNAFGYPYEKAIAQRNLKCIYET